MKKLKPVRDVVFGKMVDGYGEKRTKSGFIVVENNGDEIAIRPRWFEITHIGPKQTDIAVGEYVLVPHGRWSRKIQIDFGVGDDIFHLDTEDILGVTSENPMV